MFEKRGIVTDCFKAEVYNDADLDSEIICEIPCLSEVMVDENSSTNDFYKIYLCAGIEGFCLKRYIAIEQ